MANTVELAAPKKNDRRALRSEKAIRAAFAQLLAEKSPHKITVKEIAERANVDRKTFYLHYDSIDDLEDCILREEAARIAAVLSEKMLDENGHIDVQSLFNALESGLLENFNDRALIVRHLDTDRLLERLRPALAAETAKHHSMLTASDLGPHYQLFLGFFCAGILSLYRQWLLGDQQPPMEELVELASAVVANGMMALSQCASSRERSA